MENESMEDRIEKAVLAEYVRRTEALPAPLALPSKIKLGRVEKAQMLACFFPQGYTSPADGKELVHQVMTQVGLLDFVYLDEESHFSVE